MLTFLITGTAYSEQPPSKPFKVCPEIVTAKDTPCKTLGPTASIVQRMEIPPEKVNATKEKIIYIDNPALLARIKELEEEVAALKAAQPTSKPKVDIEKPTATRGIRG